MHCIKSCKMQLWSKNVPVIVMLENITVNMIRKKLNINLFPGWFVKIQIMCNKLRQDKTK